jgi:hypothetical protein
MAQGTPPTVKDQILAERAALDQQRGIETAQSNLPTEYAGGGIVAFDDGGGVQSDAAPADPWGQGLVNLWKSYTTGSPEALQRQGTLTPEQAAAARAKQNAIAKRAEEGNAASTTAPAQTPTAAKPRFLDEVPSKKATGPATPTTPAAPGLDSTYAKDAGGIDDLIKQLTGDLKESNKSNAEARKEAKLMAMLQAGLGIMGGTSPYAAANFKGAIPALQGYQEEMRGIRGDEAKQLAQISALNLKGAELKQELKKLGITEEYYRAHAPLFAAQAKYYSQRGTGGAGAGIANVPPAIYDKVDQRYQEYRANPITSPVFSSLPAKVQEGFKQGYKPGTQSYQNLMNEYDKYADAHMNQYLNKMQARNVKARPEVE